MLDDVNAAYDAMAERTFYDLASYSQWLEKYEHCWNYCDFTDPIEAGQQVANDHSGRLACIDEYIVPIVRCLGCRIAFEIAILIAVKS